MMFILTLTKRLQCIFKILVLTLITVFKYVFLLKWHISAFNYMNESLHKQSETPELTSFLISILLF